MRDPALDGLLLLDKPSGPTSHDMVQRVRRCLGLRRVGHAGTLDPLASGLLPLVLGRATRLMRFLPGSPKVYRGQLQLGLCTATDDLSGEVLRRHDGPLPDALVVLTAARALVGRGPQVPPAYSARKVDGRRMYRLARSGTPVAGRPVDVDVWRFDVAPCGPSGIYSFTAEVSGGTYVRALIRDLGQHLGCGGAMAALNRTSIGPMSLDQAVPGGDTLDRTGLLHALVPLERMPLVPPRLQLSASEDALRFNSGSASAVHGAVPDGLVSVLDPAGTLLGVGEVLAGRLSPRVVVGSLDDR